MNWRFLPPLALLAVGCSGSDPGPTEDVDAAIDSSGAESDVETSTPDTAVVDTSSDAADTSDSAETGTTDAIADGACAPWALQTETCGKCGNRTRMCSEDGSWLAWGECIAESGVCMAGTSRTIPCGNCGTRMQTCSASCAWGVPSECTGEKTCATGDYESKTGECGGTTDVKTRVCDSTCAWSDFGACGPRRGWVDIASAPLEGRQMHTAVWTGSEMIVWGGWGATTNFADGAAYAPSTDTWRKLAPSPLGARYHHSAVWTGSQMIVWGGSAKLDDASDGAAYDPVLDKWTALPPPPSGFVGRRRHAAVWTGTEMIVWGGAAKTSDYRSDGAAYDPSKSTWRTIAATTMKGRYSPGAAFVGGKLVLFAGYGGCPYCADAGAYDPATDTWSALTPPSSIDGRRDVAVGVSGATAAFWGGNAFSTQRADGVSFDASTSTWTLIPAAEEWVLANAPRETAVAFWAAGKLHVWGGYSFDAKELNNGAIWDPSSATWTRLTDVDAPSTRMWHTVVWTGTEAIVWGGEGASKYRADGKRFRP